MIAGLGHTLSALGAFSVGVQGTAYNVANINTDGFRPVSVHYQTGPAEQGVRPVVTREKPFPGEVPAFARAWDNLSAGQPEGQSDTQAVGKDDAPGVAPMPSFLFGLTGPAGPSHVDMAREMVNLTVNQRSFEANATVIRTTDEMLGTVIDLKV